MFGNYPLGTIVVFRYLSPTAHDTRPNVMVLAQNYNGKMHALNLRYMNPREQMVVQWFFKSWMQKQMTADPFKQIEIEFDKQMEEYKKKKQEQLDKQQAMIIRPNKQKDKTFPVSTWGPTQKQMMPANNNAPQMGQTQPEVPEPDPTLVNKVKSYLQQKAIAAQQRMAQAQAQIPTDPYQFYHGSLKPLFGRENRRFYRQYNVQLINNVRIIKGNWL